MGGGGVGMGTEARNLEGWLGVDSSASLFS